MFVILFRWPDSFSVLLGCCSFFPGQYTQTQRESKREPFYRIYRITYELFINMGYSFIYRFLSLVSFSPSLRRFCKCFLLLWAPLKPPNTVRVFNGYKIVLPALVLRDCFFIHVISLNAHNARAHLPHWHTFY